MYTVFCLCLCSISWDREKKLWICIKQSATRRWHAWLVLPLWTTALEKCFLSFSSEQGSEGEKKSNLLGTLSFFSLWMKNQHTNDADTHAKEHKNHLTHTRSHKKIQMYTPNHTHNLTKQYANTFQRLFQGNVLPSFPTHLEFVVS